MRRKNGIVVPFIIACLCSSVFAIQYPQVVLNIVSSDANAVGQITIELYHDKAPVTVENFLQYVRTGFYDDLIFHRVIANFMIQSGGYYVIGYTIYTMPTNPPIINESYNNLSNLRGTIAMARTSEPNSATSQFYINHVNNISLDRKSAAEVGYCVFGKVISDMNVVDAIAQAETIYINQSFSDFPVPLVMIKNAKLITPGYWLHADINNDGIANLRDYALFAANWKKTGSNLLGDLDHNNVVDAADLLLFANGWLKTTSWYKPIDEDINNDKIVNFEDFALLAGDWGIPGRRIPGDLNKDQTVNYLDLLRLAEHWLESAQ